MEYSLSELIDSLCIINTKIYMLIEVVNNNTDDKIVADAARKTAKLNIQRSKLKNEIDRLLNQGKEDIKT